MTDTRIPRCKAPGCDNEVPAYSGKGRPQEYCSPACRVAACRARHAVGFETAGPVATPAADAEDPVEAIAIGKFAATDEQAARALLDTHSLLSVYRRLGREARPGLAWRFTDAAARISEIVDELFGGDRGEG